MTASEPFWDVFVSYAHEDKDVIVRPLVDLLTRYGLEVWFDEFSLRLGDSLKSSLDRGLNGARFGVVILSPSFFEKKWTSFELNSLIQKENPGGKVILPLWFGIDVDAVRAFSPGLADRIAFRIDGTPEGLENASLLILQEVRPELYGHLTRRRAHLRDLAASPLQGLKSGELEKVVVPEVPVFQEKLEADLLSRIRLVRASLKEVFPSQMAGWINDFCREPFPYNEIIVWEYIAAVYTEVITSFPMKPAHRGRVFTIVLESTTFTDNLEERHAPLWRALPGRVGALLHERMSVRPPYSLWSEPEGEQ